jgi:hypothetical protein
LKKVIDESTKYNAIVSQLGREPNNDDYNKLNQVDSLQSQLNTAQTELTAAKEAHKNCGDNQTKITELENKLRQQEAELLEELNKTLGIGLESGSITKESLLSNIKDLIKGPGTPAENDCKKKLADKDTEIANLKKTIEATQENIIKETKQTFKKLGISTSD